MVKKLAVSIAAALMFVLACASTSSTASPPTCQGSGVVQFVANGHESLHNWLKVHKTAETTVLDYTYSCDNGYPKWFAAYVNRQDNWLNMRSGTRFWGLRPVKYPG